MRAGADTPPGAAPSTPPQAFTIPQKQSWDRFTISGTVMLTLITFKYMITGKLPPITYLTLLDKYVIFCFFIVFLVVEESFFAALGT